MRIGLAVEGICPGINKFVHTLVQRGNTVIGFSNGWEGLYKDESRFIDIQTTLRFENLGGSILPSSFSKYVPKSWKYKIMQNLLKYKIDLLLVIANEYSLSFVNELFSAGIKVVLIPSADFGLDVRSYRIGLNTVLSKLSECIYHFKDFSRTLGIKIVLCLSSRCKSFIEPMKSVHRFFFKEVSDQIIISWSESFENWDCIAKIDAILSASKPLEKDLFFAENLARTILSHSSLRGGSVLIYNEGFEFLTFQVFQHLFVFNNMEGGTM